MVVLLVTDICQHVAHSEIKLKQNSETARNACFSLISIFFDMQNMLISQALKLFQAVSVLFQNVRRALEYGHRLKHFDAHCCHMGTTIKPSFVIFDIRAL